MPEPTPGLPGIPGGFAPSATPAQGADRPAAGPPVFVLASWGQRAIAYLIDFAILLVPMLAVWAVLLPPLIGRAADDERLSADLDVLADPDADPNAAPVGRLLLWALGITLAALLAYFVVVGIYHALFASREGAQTPGQRKAGIKVVRTGGQRVGVGYAVYRVLVVRELLFGLGTLCTGGLLVFAQYLLPIVDGQRRTLHDMVSRSRMVLDGTQGR